MLKSWIVLYVIAEDIVPQVFLCQAEDMDHAEEQCLDAYPDVDIVWAEEGEEGRGTFRAFANYWNSDTP